MTTHSDQTLLNWTNEFITFFSGIPEGRWCTGAAEDKFGRHCANGLCGVPQAEDWYGRMPEKAKRLQKVFAILSSFQDDEDYPEYSYIAQQINNSSSIRYPQPTPKQRILAALTDIKNILESRIPRKDITQELAVLPPDEKADTFSKELVKR